jgi:hypothetical protein
MAYDAFIFLQNGYERKGPRWPFFHETLEGSGKIYRSCSKALILFQPGD